MKAILGHGVGLPRFHTPRLSAVALALLFCSTALGASSHSKSPDAVDFNRDIRPILSENCYTCHGPDPDKRKAGLRLDIRTNAVSELKSGDIAIVPGKSAKSKLIERITTKDEDDRMPPAKTGKHLTEAQIETLRRWIEQGAEYKPHWAFITPERPALPEVRNIRWPRNGVDYFILSRLERNRFTPEPEADKPTLIRRVTFDLTGLPPTPAEVDAFLADEQPDAYERLVDRLLDSPRYGEHMARYWLDAARYGDTHGLHLDNERSMWPYRDWVVGAFNRNLPFDEFTIEQLAGDLLPNATQEQKVASGFNRCNVSTSEGGAIDEEFYVRYAVDRTEVTTGVWMGLTAGCAVCHDHKYDPISQKEFYQLYAFFNNVSEKAMDGNALLPPPTMKITTAEQSAKLAELNAKIGPTEKTIREMASKIKYKEPPVQTNAAAKTEDLSSVSENAWEQRAKTNAAAAMPRDVLNAIKLARGKRSKGQAKLVRDYYVAYVYAPERKTFEPFIKQINDAKKQRDELDNSLPATMVMEELKDPRAAYILKRGDYDKRLDMVSRGVPAVLPKLAAGGTTNRLDLARWLVAKDHPLTARVTVNRFWQQFFGTGIVKTANDFGSQGEFPINPELLDWLACEFRDGPAGKSLDEPSELRTAWNIKHIVRLLVTSSAYRQDSRVTTRKYEFDPENRLVSRGPRFRMDAEIIRDNALFVSGLLVEKMGGRGVRPYQPEGIWEAVGYTASNTAKFTQDHGEALYRRSLYTFWKRTAPPPSLITFDAPSRERSCTRRERTDTPLQALVTMNDVQFVEAERQFGERLIEHGATPEQRIDFGFRTVTSRHPTKREMQVLKNALTKFLNKYESNKDAAAKLLAIGESPANKALNPSEFAAYAMLGSVLLNLDEALNN